MDNEKKNTGNRTPQRRNSRAAQAAQRRREERKERARLDNLREKQTRKAKRRNKVRKRIKRETLRRILIMGGIVLAIVLSMIIFFRVRSVEVQGCGYYSAEEIIAASGTEEGDNLLILSRAEIAGNIMAKCPYVASVQVTRQLPDTVVITVKEFDATYAVRDGDGIYYLITATGKATEQISEAKAADYIRIHDLTILTPQIGETVSVMAPIGQEVAAEGQMHALTMLLQAIEEGELLKQITSISVPTSFEISLWYEERFLVEIGDTSDLDYKMNYLKKVVSSQKTYATGTIDLRQAVEGKAFVTLNDQ